MPANKNTIDPLFSDLSSFFSDVYTVNLTCILSLIHKLNRYPIGSDSPLCCNLLTFFRQHAGMPVQALLTACQQAIYYQDNYLWRTDASFFNGCPLLCGSTQQQLPFVLSHLGHTSQITAIDSIRRHTIPHLTASG